jgi:hypothetical protein
MLLHFMTVTSYRTIKMIYSEWNMWQKIVLNVVRFISEAVDFGQIHCVPFLRM